MIRDMVSQGEINRGMASPRTARFDTIHSARGSMTD